MSSGGQDVATQKAKLEKLGADVVFTETGNGSSLNDRDQLEAAIRLLDPQDVLLALHPDRLARETGDLLAIAKRVVEHGAILRIDNPKIIFDGTDMMAEVMLTLFDPPDRRGNSFAARNYDPSVMRILLATFSLISAAVSSDGDNSSVPRLR